MLVLTAFSRERVSFEEAEFVQLVAPKFSPLLLVLRPSELLVRQLLEEGFCVLEEQDFELKSLATFFSVSARDFDLDFRRVPSLELSAPEAGVLLPECRLFLPDSFFFFFFALAGLSVGVTDTDFLVCVGIFVRLICQPFVSTQGVHGNV